MVSQCRQNFHEECEAAINKQINMELNASYAYLALAAHFDRDDVALKNVSDKFRHESHEERSHAEKLIDYQNKRGGRVVLHDLPKPKVTSVKSITEAYEIALQMEKDVNESLLEMHKIADKHHDAQFADFIESEFLEEQVNGIKEIGDILTNSRRNGDGLGEFLMNKLHFKD